MNQNNETHQHSKEDSTEPKLDGATAAIISLRTGDLITRAWTILKKSLKQVAAITFFGMIVPQLAFTWILAHKAGLIFEEMRGLAAAARTDSAPQVFLLAIDATMRFISAYGGAAILLAAIMLTSYTGIVQLSLDRLRRKRPQTTYRLLVTGLKATMRTGLWAVCLLGVLLTVAQIFPPLAVVIAVLGVMIPVIAVAEKAGPFKTFWRTITLRFAPKSRLGRWPVFFALLSLGGVFYLSEFALTLLVEYSNKLENVVSLPGFLMNKTISGVPFTPIYAIADFADTILGITLLPLLAASTSVLYVRVKKLTESTLAR